MPSSQSNSRPRRKRGVAWFTIFLIAFAVTSYLVRDWGQTPSAPSSTPVASAEQQPSDATQPASAEAGEQGVADVPFLSELGGERWQSPAGLVYGPGSAEGHRLKHLARHLQDQPDRDVHGVFDGELPDVLQWIDLAYRGFRAGDAGVKSRQQGERTVIDAELEQTVGYVGGKDGKREGNPATNRLRLIVEDHEVITAYPVWPRR